MTRTSLRIFGLAVTQHVTDDTSELGTRVTTLICSSRRAGLIMLLICTVFVGWPPSHTVSDPVGIPAFFFYMLFTHRKRLDEPATKAKLGILYGGKELVA